MCAGVSEGGRDLSAEAAAAGQSGRGDAAGRRDGGPQGSTEGAQRSAERARGGRDQPQRVLLHQNPGAGALRGRAADHAGRGTHTDAIRVTATQKLGQM